MSGFDLKTQNYSCQLYIIPAIGSHILARLNRRLPRSFKPSVISQSTKKSHFNVTLFHKFSGWVLKGFFFLNSKHNKFSAETMTPGNKNILDIEFLCINIEVMVILVQKYAKSEFNMYNVLEFTIYTLSIPCNKRTSLAQC